MRELAKLASRCKFDDREADLVALFTLAGRISVGREVPDVATFDEGIAPAIFEEKDTTDGHLAAGRKLTEKVNKADLVFCKLT